MEKFGGNTNRASSGMNAAETNIQLHHGIVDNMDDFYKETYKGGGKLNDPELLKYFTSHSALAIDWLKEHIIKLEDLITDNENENFKIDFNSNYITEITKRIKEDNMVMLMNTSVSPAIIAENEYSNNKYIVTPLRVVQ